MIFENLFIGNDDDCTMCNPNWAIIHACKTCHQRGVGYRGNLSSSHPNYLILEQDNHLYLNMVDMERELLPKYAHPIMKVALDFIKKHISISPVLVHCNQGYSRSPSIGLLYLCKWKKIASDSYSEAKNEFIKLYTQYVPGRGIELYLMHNWNELMDIEKWE